jgi:Acetyltransferase (GNAT) family.
MDIIRATTLAERAGAYYVRIQAMARKHRIPLHLEFDEHDNDSTKYIVVVDDYLPVATCRMYPLDGDRMMLGRVVVLPEYRRQGIGSMVVHEAEAWAKELGYKTACIESRDNKVRFYEGMGYVSQEENVISGEVFDCIRMEKDLSAC